MPISQRWSKVTCCHEISDSDRTRHVEPEMLSVLFAMDRFHSYVFGRAITIITIDKPLNAIVKKPWTSALKRLQRMLLRLQKYNLSLSANQAARCYLPTAEWTDADWLQRRLDFISRGGAAAGALLGDVTDLIKRATATDDQYQLLRHQIATMLPSCLLRYESLRHFLMSSLKSTDSLVFKGQRVIVPADARPEMLRGIHSSHVGVKGWIRQTIKAVFYPGMTADMKKVFNSCAATVMNIMRLSNNRSLHEYWNSCLIEFIMCINL